MFFPPVYRYDINNNNNNKNRLAGVTSILYLFLFWFVFHENRADETRLSQKINDISKYPALISRKFKKSLKYSMYSWKDLFCNIDHASKAWNWICIFHAFLRRNIRPPLFTILQLVIENFQSSHSRYVKGLFFGKLIFSNRELCLFSLKLNCR